MANRFWVAQPVSGAIVSVASPPQVRLTVSSTTGMTTGDVRVVSGIVGTTEANGTWTITVIDATHIDLQGTTFANLYTSGGIVLGKWDATNTNNWVTTSGGTNYGQTVPSSADVVTLDGSSGGGTVTVNATIAVQNIVCGAFTGTLDFSANNNNVTLSATGGFSGSGAGTRTINLGNGTWSLSGASANWTMTTMTGLTFNANGSTIAFTGTISSTNQRVFAGGGLTYNIVTFGAGVGPLTVQQSNTFATLNITAPNVIFFTNGTTQTITNAFTWAGSSSAENDIRSTSATAVATISVTSGSPTMSWAGLRQMTFSGGATFTATNSFDFQANTGITITAPTLERFSGGLFI